MALYLIVSSEQSKNSGDCREISHPTVIVTITELASLSELHIYKLIPKRDKLIINHCDGFNIMEIVVAIYSATYSYHLAFLLNIRRQSFIFCHCGE